MVTTEELITLAEKESREIGEAEEEISLAEEKAMKEWETKIAREELMKEKEKAIKIAKGKKIYARYQSTKKLGTLKPSGIGKMVTKVFRQAATQYKKSLKPVKVKRKPMPPQLRKAMEKRIVLRQPRSVPMPQSIRQLQNVRNLRPLLTRQEQMEVDGIFSGSQRMAAMKILRRRLKEQQVNKARSNPRIVYKRDIMTGRTTIDKKIPTERWLM